MDNSIKNEIENGSSNWKKSIWIIHLVWTVALFFIYDSILSIKSELILTSGQITSKSAYIEFQSLAFEFGALFGGIFAGIYCSVFYCYQKRKLLKKINKA